MSQSGYVTTEAWIRQVGRPDLIDEVADQFERPAAVGAEPVSVLAGAVAGRWPRRSRGWRSQDLLGHRATDPISR